MKKVDPSQTLKLIGKCDSCDMEKQHALTYSWILLEQPDNVDKYNKVENFEQMTTSGKLKPLINVLH